MRYVVNKYSTLDNLVYIHIHILNLVCGTYFYEYFISIAIQIISFDGEHEAINAVGVYFLHDDIRCIIHYISQMDTDAFLGHHCSCRFDIN